MLNLSEYSRFVDIIRRNEGISKSALSDLSGLSLPTTHDYIKKLATNNILLDASQGPSVTVNSKYCYYLGVAIGGANIKVTIIDFAYRRIINDDIKNKMESKGVFSENTIAPVKWMYAEDCQCFCTKTPDDITGFLSLMDDIFSSLKVINEQIFHMAIKGIGFAFSGAVNHETKTIVKSPNIPYLEDVGINMLISTPHLGYCAQNDIQISFENNANAAVIAEKYALQMRTNIDIKTKTSKNIACLYLGTGLGLGTILNNALYRGAMHSGEIGFIPIFLNLDMQAASNQKAMYLEQYIRSEIWDVSDEKTMKEWGMEQMRARLSETSSTGIRYVELLGEAIGYAINIISLMLNVDVIILTGRLTGFLRDPDLCMWTAINKKRLENQLGYVKNNCSVIESEYGVAAPAIGAAITAAFDCVNAPLSWNEV